MRRGVLCRRGMNHGRGRCRGRGSRSRLWRRLYGRSRRRCRVGVVDGLGEGLESLLLLFDVVQYLFLMLLLVLLVLELLLEEIDLRCR